ncbi:regulator of G-protein signaling 9-binding protein [Pristis pectinata]|uniref:regulator of G-protein signaling 9-binding protein n=1 Tax=Pristis pectinata TaxID=685728 RepID=UPI00223E14B9|nr:regulator of G-protein signaling 9-binding protein [Pristis pectinata]
MVKDECKMLLDALNKVSACYRHLVICAGGTSDSQNLREELKKTRRKAQVLAVANKNKLITILKDKTISKDDRAEFERLWVLFSTCMEVLEIDMRRALELGQEFPLNVPTKHLIQTGMIGGTSAVAARAMNVQNMNYEEGNNIDIVDLTDLEQEINEVGEMIYEMEMKVNVLQWTVEAKQGPGSELKSTASAGVSSLAVMSVSGGGNDKLCDTSKVFAGAMFSAVLIIAIALAVCIVKFA